MDGLTWFGWTFVAVVALSSLLTVAGIGKPREPATPGLAVCVLIINALLLWGAVTVGTTP